MVSLKVLVRLKNVKGNYSLLIEGEVYSVQQFIKWDLIKVSKCKHDKAIVHFYWTRKLKANNIEEWPRYIFEEITHS